MAKDELDHATHVSRVNTDLGRYCVRLLEESDPRSTTAYTTPMHRVENDLATDLLELGQILVKRAGLHHQADTMAPLTVPGTVLDT